MNIYYCLYVKHDKINSQAKKHIMAVAIWMQMKIQRIAWTERRSIEAVIRGTDDLGNYLQKLNIADKYSLGIV